MKEKEDVENEVVEFPSFSFSHAAPLPAAKYNNALIPEKTSSPATSNKRRYIVRPPPAVYFLDTKEDVYLAICSPADTDQEILTDDIPHCSFFPLGISPIYSVKYYRDGTFILEKVESSIWQRYFESGPSKKNITEVFTYKILPNTNTKGCLGNDFVSLEVDLEIKEEYSSFLTSRLKIEGKLKNDPLNIQLWKDLIDCQNLDSTLNKIQIVHKRIAVCEKALKRLGVCESLLLLYFDLHCQALSFDESLKLWNIILSAGKTKDNWNYKIAFIDYLLARSGTRYAVNDIVDLIVQYIKSLTEVESESKFEEIIVKLCEYLIRVLLNTGYVEQAFIILMALCNHDQPPSISSIKQTFPSVNSSIYTQTTIASSLLLLNVNDKEEFYTIPFKFETVRKSLRSLSINSIKRLVGSWLSCYFQDDSLKTGNLWNIVLNPIKGNPEIKMNISPNQNVIFPISMFNLLCDSRTDSVCLDLIIRTLSIYDLELAVSLVKRFLSLRPSDAQMWICFIDLQCLQRNLSNAESYLVKILSSSLEMTIDQRLYMIKLLIQLKYSSVTEDEVRNILIKHCVGVNSSVQSLKLKKFLEGSSDGQYFWNLYYDPSSILQVDRKTETPVHRISPKDSNPIFSLAELQAYSIENPFSSIKCIIKATSMLKKRLISSDDFEEYCLSWAVRGCYLSDYSIQCICINFLR